ncbi:M13 family metallopeptidase [Ferruginibacter sp. HRS2-29]|uniref:M13 family metallopeptidase n=1 Tax=Ferruginibacter sp. HRS2-29 TaxID=2487334 RepID=UPI0020CB9ACF|nr:M13 family metallopeptidase [Ferruginibacter sp. HRS2-29]MCP9750692.1 M13 family peptidase [Ferruginibacter sp. HRS2-29]
MKHFSLAIAAACLVGMASCNNEKKTDAAETRTSFFDRSGMDSTVKPGDNFFMYANGAWMKTSVIPDDQTGLGSFYTLYEDNLKKLRGILEDAEKAKAAKGSTEQKLGDYYASGMDTVAIDKLGAEPLKPMLAKIDAIKDYKELMNLVAESNAAGETSLIGYYVDADEKNSAQNIMIFYQTGLSLPEKGYYTRTDSASKAARTALLQYISKVFTLTGADTATAAKNAVTILALETEMAKAHRTPVELRNPQANYNKLAIADLEKKATNVGWANILSKIGVKVDSVNVGQPGYYEALSKMLATLPIDTWKTKLKFDYISSNSGYLSKDFADADFTFNKTFSGQKKDSDRWKKMVNRVDGGMGDLLGQLYVKKYFTEAAKARMDELVNNLQKAFEARIKKLDWMGDSTKQRAVTKLNTFLKKIGYPTKWKNYDDVTIDKANFFANVKSVGAHLKKEETSKIGKPVDKTDWGMSAPTVNAYYNPTNNEIVFPAGILQFPFFDVNADDAVNYGAIGMVIGHEMTHGFDDQGSQYDEKGNMKNWWTAIDNEKFKAKTGGVVKQYSAYTVLDSLHVNGELTLGENLADIGGLAIAYDAFKMTKQGQDTVKIDGFTPDQRFFLGYAQVWRLKNRDETMRSRINVDPHSPEMFRVNGPAANFDPFYAAFGIKEGDKLYIAPENRAHIW